MIKTTEKIILEWPKLLRKLFHYDQNYWENYFIMTKTTKKIILVCPKLLEKLFQYDQNYWENYFSMTKTTKEDTGAGGIWDLIFIWGGEWEKYTSIWWFRIWFLCIRKKKRRSEENNSNCVDGVHPRFKHSLNTNKKKIKNQGF